MKMHVHHIKPKHAGGTDDPSNLLKCNIAMHAFLHELRYKETGDILDKIAAAALRGQIGKEEAQYRAANEMSNRWKRENPEKHREISREGNLAAQQVGAQSKGGKRYLQSSGRSSADITS